MLDTAGEGRIKSQVTFSNGFLCINTLVCAYQRKLIFIRSVWTLGVIWRTLPRAITDEDGWLENVKETLLDCEEDDEYEEEEVDCFLVSHPFSVARHVGRLKLGWKPAQPYVRLSIILLSQQANHVSSGIIRHYVLAFVCLHFCLTRYQSAQFSRRAFHIASGNCKFLRQGVHIYIYIYIYIYTYIYIYIYICVCKKREREYRESCGQIVQQARLFHLVMATNLGERKLLIQTCESLHNNWPNVASCSFGGVG